MKRIGNALWLLTGMTIALTPAAYTVLAIMRGAEPSWAIVASLLVGQVTALSAMAAAQVYGKKAVKRSIRKEIHKVLEEERNKP